MRHKSRRTLCQGRSVRACVHSVGMLCGYMPNSSLEYFSSSFILSKRIAIILVLVLAIKIALPGVIQPSIDPHKLLVTLGKGLEASRHPSDVSTEKKSAALADICALLRAVKWFLSVSPIVSSNDEGPSSNNGITWPIFVRAGSAFCLVSSKKWSVLFSVFDLSPVHHVLNWQVFYIDIGGNIIIIIIIPWRVVGGPVDDTKSAV